MNWILENDPEDLDLTFSVDEELFGQVITAWFSASLFTGILGVETFWKNAHTQYSGFSTCAVLNVVEESLGY